MAIEHIVGLDTRIADLKRKLDARSGQKEYAENCKALRAEIERLEALRDTPPVASPDERQEES